jgi:acetoacetyl-CoA synthetase
MAALAVRRMREVQPHGPYALAGYSLGGLIAFEAARQLARDGDQVRHLVLLDTSPLALQRGLVERAVHRLRAIRHRRADRRAGDLWTLAAANHRAWERYELRPYDGPVILLRTAPDLRERGGHHLGWDKVVRGPIHVAEVPGDHLVILDDPWVEHTGRTLTAMLRSSNLEHRRT